MGNASGTHVIAPTPRDGLRSNRCLVSFPAQCVHDELYISYGDASLHTLLDDTIRRTWPRGITEVREYVDNLGGFKLKGTPFGSYWLNSSKEGIKVSQMLCAIVAEMMMRGWVLESTINFYRHSKSDSFLFKRVEDKAFQPQVCAINLQSSDQIQMVGIPIHFYKFAVELMEKHWKDGLKKHKIDEVEGTFKCTFKGYPWRATFIHPNLANSRMVVLELVRAMASEGYEILGSGHPNQTVEEVDTMFFALSTNPKPLGESFMLQVHRCDYLLTIDAPLACVDAVRECIKTSWPQGLKKEEEIGPMVAMKMHGYPWHTSRDTAIKSRMLMLSILETLRSRGYRVYATIDINKGLGDASAFVMVSCPPERRQYMAIKQGSTDLIRLINTPSDVESVLRQFFADSFPGETNERDSHGCVTFKLKRNLKECQSLFCFIVDKVESLGWTLISSADLSVKYHADKNSQFPIDLHTLIFEK